MTLLIVGATGTLGRQIARRALDEGYEVRCLVRSPRKAAFLKEWGAHLIQGDLCKPSTLPPALEGVTAVIDAATSRATESLRIQRVDWDGKVSLIQAAKAAGIERFIFFSIMAAAQYPNVPLMDIKQCTEDLLQKSGLNYTTLRPCGFFQGLIGQYGIPVLEGQSVWVTGEATPTAYMDTQDIARFAIQGLTQEATYRKDFDLAGPRAWSAEEIIQLCERLSGKDAKIARIPIRLLRGIQKTVSFFEWGWNIADRLAFAEVLTSGRPLTAPMEATYAAFGIAPDSIADLESYMQDYFSRMLKKLKELDYNKQKEKSNKRSPFKSSQST
ncbi:MAG: SDR family oxidoreductase [Thermosynechococcaceae cyanobacterium]